MKTLLKADCYMPIQDAAVELRVSLDDLMAVTRGVDPLPVYILPYKISKTHVLAVNVRELNEWLFRHTEALPHASGIKMTNKYPQFSVA